MISDRGKLVVAVLLGAVGLYGMMSSRPVMRPPGIIAPYAPLQTPSHRAAFRVGDLLLEPQAEFSIEARVLSVMRYRWDASSRVSPLDFAVGWGPMSDSARLRHFKITQGGRFFTLYPNSEAIDLDIALVSSTNLHLIPATSRVRSLLLNTRPGHVVTLRGLLVNIRADDGFTWNTSLTREDTGAGACELFWVEEVQKT